MNSISKITRRAMQVVAAITLTGAGMTAAFAATAEAATSATGAITPTSRPLGHASPGTD
ncbi:hypothetical protein ACO0LF_18940 [Undibacterium sp. Di27W]|uniref:hypothetical protein n=1 Tax=Undibacterium sp. Di27W TaxID=3413036 RepID=UPI003BEFA24D